MAGETLRARRPLSLRLAGGPFFCPGVIPIFLLDPHSTGGVAEAPRLAKN